VGQAGLAFRVGGTPAALAPFGAAAQLGRFRRADVRNFLIAEAHRSIVRVEKSLHDYSLILRGFVFCPIVRTTMRSTGKRCVNTMRRDSGRSRTYGHIGVRSHNCHGAHGVRGIGLSAGASMSKARRVVPTMEKKPTVATASIKRCAPSAASARA